MGVGKILARVINFFREDLSEVISAYFDGEKIFVVRLTEKFETVEIDADNSEIEHIAQKISLVCRERGWKTQAVGFCLQEGDAVTYQTEVENIPEKEIPAFVKSWATAQTGKDSSSAFTRINAELWMETLPRTTLDEICAAFERFGLKLRALSIMPTDILTKVAPFDRTEFISEVVRHRKAPNLLAARGNVVNLKKVSAAIAAIFFITILGFSTKIFFDHRTASNELDAAEISVSELKTELELKQNIDADVAELNRLNQIAAAQNVTPTKFNFLLNLGKITDGVRLTKVHCDENFLAIEGESVTPDAVKNYLSRVKSSVAQSARLENSSEHDDGKIFFVIRAAL